MDFFNIRKKRDFSLQNGLKIGKLVRKNVKKIQKKFPDFPYKFGEISQNVHVGPNFDASYLGNGSSFFDSVKSSWSHIFQIMKYLITREKNIFDPGPCPLN